MTDAYVWTVVAGLGLVTYLIRFSFLGLMRGAPSPFLERLLRYVPVAVIPALVAPLIVLDRAGPAVAGAPLWLAAAATLAVGAASRTFAPAVLAGMLALHAARAAGL